MEENERQQTEEAEEEKSELTDEEYFGRAEEHLKAGQTELAQKALNCIIEESGRKYFLQSEIYRQKKWYNEQHKQLKAAVKAEPDNEEYKKALDELNEFKKTGEYKQYKKAHAKREMGNACGEGCAECCCAGTCECLCNGICEGLGGC